MSTNKVYLRRLENHYWCLYSANNSAVCSPQRYPSKFDAYEWARKFCDTWHDWFLVVEPDGEAIACPKENEDATTAKSPVP